MPSRFDNFHMKIVAISPSATLRSLLSSVIRELGFQNVSAVADIKTCIEIMETERIFWVICPVQDKIGGNVLQLLDILDKHPQLRATKVSILREADDSVIPQAFALGCFSCHAMDLSRESSMLEFQKLLSRIEEHRGDYARVAADYLRDYLFEKNEYQELKRFFRSLLQVYPGDFGLLTDLARTLLKAGDAREARVIMQQIVLLCPDRADEIRTLATQNGGTPLEEGPAPFLADHFGFKSCLVLEPDPDTLAKVESALKAIGFKTISAHRDPVSALKWIRTNEKPDLVLSEWKLPHLPGPIFLYKLRHRLDEDVPLIVINEGLKARENTWLQELGVSRLVAKPIEETQFYDAVLWVLQQRSGASDLQSLKRKLCFLSKRRDSVEMPRVRHSYMNHPALLEGDRLLMEAILAFDSGCFLHAKAYALDALKNGADSREALELLGKALMQLREFDAALRCLENVNLISPYNVAHLCQIAECHLENGDDQSYEKMIDQARSIDKDAIIVVETEVKGALKHGHAEAARKLLQRLKSFKEILSFMNNRAVSLMRVGNPKEAFALYQSALESIPDGQSEVRSLLYYNMGLGYARINRLEEALKFLELAAQTQNPQRQKKASSLKNRVFVSLQTGEPLQLQIDGPPSESEEAERLKRAIEEASSEDRQLNRVDFCLSRIYTSLLDSKRANEFLQNPIVFTPRGRLVKDPMRGLTSESA